MATELDIANPFAALRPLGSTTPVKGDFACNRRYLERNNLIFATSQL